MGIERVVFYTIRCNRCNWTLEDFIGEVCRTTENNRPLAERLARKNGFLQITANRWICPNCVKELQEMKEANANKGTQ